MFDVSDLRATIVPKSDQLNAEQLLGGPMTVTVADVRIGGDDQPVIIHYENDQGRPYKPCKTMRKVLIFAWGEDGRAWPGRSMTLYNDPAVKFGGMDVGGIRISHLTDIPRDVQIALTATKGKKALHVIKAMAAPEAAMQSSITAAQTVDALKAAFAAAYKSTGDKVKRAGFKAAYDSRMAVLTKPAGKTLDQYIAEVDNATSAETAALVLDEARDTLSQDDLAALGERFAIRWEPAQRSSGHQRPEKD